MERTQGMIVCLNKACAADMETKTIQEQSKKIQSLESALERKMKALETAVKTLRQLSIPEPSDTSFLAQSFLTPFCREALAKIKEELK
jgi:hypothetical protein